MSGSCFNFSEWLMDELENRHMTTKDLADKTGVANMTIRYYITEDRMPSLRIFTLFLNAFNQHIEIKNN